MDKMGRWEPEEGSYEGMRDYRKSFKLMFNKTIICLKQSNIFQPLSSSFFSLNDNNQPFSTRNFFIPDRFYVFYLCGFSIYFNFSVCCCLKHFRDNF